MRSFIFFVLGFCCSFAFIQAIKRVAAHDATGAGVMTFFSVFAGTILVLMFLEGRKKPAK